MEKKAVSIKVFGIVQSVGFRPVVSRHAIRFGIEGFVCNMGPYVEIFAQAPPKKLEAFIGAVRHEPPKRAVILKMDVEDARVDDSIHEFAIAKSGHISGDIFVSPDIAICEDCKRELYDRKDRRYLHPFINCTCCGPRLTILDGMPYDRVRTSMKTFPLCEKCEYEYTHPETRRYDAQPVCCNDCGPEVYLLDRPERGLEAIRKVRQAIREGKIVAIKGIGGFHLCVDATNDQAVRRLRERKKRPAKPFAVMMRDIETVRRECETSPLQDRILEGHQKPILLLPGKEEGRIAPSVAPANPKIGVMLPYAPVQLLLFDCGDGEEISDCLVMTSANTSGAPICRDDEDARRELKDLCDLILSHNRPILIRADDTVMDDYKGKPYMIRRSRGYAPLPFLVSGKREGCVLAVGGELKNTFCIAKNNLLYPSPYIGDMGDLRTVRALDESVARMSELLEAKPEKIICDLHPSYNTVHFARELAEKMSLPLEQVQHHYAHILSCMAENDLTGPVIGVSFDGTGFGTDETIWGGEILLCDLKGFERFGSIEPFMQLGGDSSAIECHRIAAALLFELAGAGEGMALGEELLPSFGKDMKILSVMWKKGINSVRSTSAGRLFDGVSALLGIRTLNTFEGEASMALQFSAMKYRQERRNEYIDTFGYEDADGTYRLPTHSLIQYLVRGIREKEPVEKLAWDFHDLLARMITSACKKARSRTGWEKVCLSGGVFQNTLLLALCEDLLSGEGFEVYRHHMLAPNDGGICLGQALYGLSRLENSKRKGNTYVCRFTGQGNEYEERDGSCRCLRSKERSRCRLAHGS